MAIYKRGKTYWFEFVFNGRRVRRSAQTSNRKAAREIESAYRTKLAKGEVGIEERKKVPGFSSAMKDLLEKRLAKAKGDYLFPGRSTEGLL